MSAILDLVKQHRSAQFAAGERVLEQGDQRGIMLVLLEGDVEILRDGIRVATAAEPGVIFGEMSALLGGPHTATVRARVRSSFAVIEKPREFLDNSAPASLYVA